MATIRLSDPDPASRTLEGVDDSGYEDTPGGSSTTKIINIVDNQRLLSFDVAQELVDKLDDADEYIPVGSIEDHTTLYAIEPILGWRDIIVAISVARCHDSARISPTSTSDTARESFYLSNDRSHVSTADYLFAGHGNVSTGNNTWSIFHSSDSSSDDSDHHLPSTGDSPPNSPPDATPDTSPEQLPPRNSKNGLDGVLRNKPDPSPRNISNILTGIKEAYPPGTDIMFCFDLGKLQTLNLAKVEAKDEDCWVWGEPWPSLEIRDCQLYGPDGIACSWKDYVTRQVSVGDGNWLCCSAWKDTGYHAVARIDPVSGCCDGIYIIADLDDCDLDEDEDHGLDAVDVVRLGTRKVTWARIGGNLGELAYEKPVRFENVVLGDSVEIVEAFWAQHGVIRLRYYEGPLG